MDKTERIPLVRGNYGAIGSQDPDISQSRHRNTSVIQSGYPTTSIAKESRSRTIEPANQSLAAIFSELRPNYPKDLFLRDGKKLIDFVFAFQPALDEKDPILTTTRQKYREVFQNKLRDIGMCFEAAGLEESQDGKTCFVKMHAPLKTLAVLAEASDMRFPLKDQGNQPIRKPAARICRFMPKENNLDPEWDKRVPDLYTAPFRRTRAKDFYIGDRYTFMSKLQRTQLVYEAIEKTLIDPEDIESCGLEPLVPFPTSLLWLLESNIFEAAYPLHDGELKKADMDKPPEEYTARQRLRASWASFKFSQLFKSQPIDEIRNYFGEKIAMYFAWLGFYTWSLVPVSILGCLVPLYGIVFAFTDIPIKQVCDQSSEIANWTFCPDCAGGMCPAIKMHSFCRNLRISHVFTNNAAIVFTFIMSLWSATYRERWKRRQAMLAAHWETYGEQRRLEQVRPDYYRYATVEKPHPITGLPELFVPKRTRFRSFVRSIFAIGFMIIVVIAAVSGIIFYKMICAALVNRDLMQHPDLRGVSPTLVESVTGAVLNTIVIMILSKIYSKLSWWLTVHEYPRTWDEFERSYVLKMFVFQFINYYALMFYLAFVEGNLADGPQDDSIYTGDQKDPGFFLEVTIQLASIIIVKSVVGNIVEIAIPVAKVWLRRRKLAKDTEENPYEQWEQDHDLNVHEHLSLVDEYFEMILQYGLVTMFVPAFPLAPLMALGNNIFEIRIDATKFLVETQRAVPVRVRDIGIFYTLMDFATNAAIVVNGAILAFSCDFIPRIVVQELHGSLDNYWEYVTSTYVVQGINGTGGYECRYMGMYSLPWSKRPFHNTEIWWQVWLAKIAFIFIYENMVFLVKVLVDRLVPDVPDDVELKQDRERYMQRQLLYKAEFGNTTAEGIAQASSAQRQADMNGDLTKPSNLQSLL